MIVDIMEDATWRFGQKVPLKELQSSNDVFFLTKKGVGDLKSHGV